MTAAEMVAAERERSGSDWSERSSRRNGFGRSWPTGR